MLCQDEKLKWNVSPTDGSSAEIDTGVGVLNILLSLQGNSLLLNIFASFSSPPVLMCSSLFTLFMWTAYCLILF